MNSDNCERSFLKYYICRISGLPTDKIENLKSKRLQEKFVIQHTIYNEITTLSESISNDLYTLIQKTNEKKIKSKLIDLRRNIFNNKLIYYHNYSVITNSTLKEKINNYLELLKNKNQLKSGFEGVYEHEKSRIRNEFKQELLDPDFQKGLLLSSKSLFTQQKIYLNDDHVNYDRKVDQIERGLLRYFTRASMKATPFGTFCSIVPGVVTSNGMQDNLLKISGDPSSKRSLLLINKDIYGIISNFIKKESELKKHLNIELNKTIEVRETIYYFLTESDGKEIFQRIDKNEVMDLILLEFENKSIIKYDELVNRLLTNEDIDASAEEISAYLDKLLEIGLIRLKIGIPEQSVDWINSLTSIIEQITSPKAILIKDALRKVQEIIYAYEIDTVEKRQKHLDEIFNIIEDLFKELQITNNIRSNLPLYEDATANVKVELTDASLAKIRENLFTFINITKKLAYPRTELANMRHFFKNHYNNIQHEVTLLEFYEDYYREHLKAHIEKEQKIRNDKNAGELKDYDVSNPFNLELIKEITKARNKFSKFIIDKWLTNPSSYEINLTKDDLIQSYYSVDDISSKNLSVSIFSQIISSDGNGSQSLILPDGRYLMGFGKYFSRFVYLFDSKVLEGIYESNSTSNGELLVEISGDANFNANLHPPLLKYEICYPTSEVGLAEIQLKCTDIVVECDSADPYRLCLKHKPTNSYVLPLDLGFLNPMMRPPLYQLLSKFSPPCTFALQLPENPYIVNQQNTVKKEGKNSAEVSDSEKSKENNEKKKTNIIYRPRILFENNIVLSRRCWFVPKDLLPQIANDKSDYDFFIRVNCWREENNIPGEVYVRVRPLPIPGTTLKDNKDDSKKNKTENGNKQSIEETKPVENNKHSSEQKENAPKIASVELKEENKTDQTNKNKPQNRFSRDYYKPQYIDFFNPLLVDLFGKMTVGLKNYLVTIEERYPIKSQLPDYEDKTYSTEQIFQIDFKKTNNN